MGACAAKAAQIKDQHDPSDNIPKKKKKKLTRAQKEVDAVLNHLAVPTMAVKKFLTFFKKMDDDSSGSISLEEFIVFLKVRAKQASLEPLRNPFGEDEQIRHY